jgi:hypothetical protein
MSIDYRKTTTWAEFMAMTAEQRRRFLDQLFREWDENRRREIAEDDRADGKRGHWGD